jgi:hypothetical protein
VTVEHRRNIGGVRPSNPLFARTLAELCCVLRTALRDEKSENISCTDEFLRATGFMDEARMALAFKNRRNHE